MLPSGAIEIHHPSKGNFTMNGMRLKFYLDGDYSNERVSIVLDVPK